MVAPERHKRWDYTFEWSLRNEVVKESLHGFDYRYVYATYGIEQALYYKLNCQWALGFRMDWTHFTLLPDADIYAITFGANWKPRPWLLIRPEIRYDEVHGYGGHKLFNLCGDSASNQQISGGFSTVVRF